jgi:murein DD-endopeptidase MepM/ murein hydrolase activator NlpD
MSAIRDGIDAARRPSPRRRATGPHRPPRAGLIDLFLVVCVLWFAGLRTPAGGLVLYGIELARGHDADLPTLTAWFDQGAAAPPDLGILSLTAPTPVPEGGLPEPYRTAARAVLADPPQAIATALASRADLPPEDRAVAALDVLYTDDAELALELLVLTPALRDRAIQRARAAGEHEPERYASHRSYLPLSVAHDADRVVTGTMALASALDLAWPVHIDHRVSSPFGMRVHPVMKKTLLHNGIDLAVPIGTPIYSPQDGEITVIGEDARSGRYVVVQHAHGVRTTYCHIQHAEVALGDLVTRGDRIALSGNTGRSTGPHLHWIVRIAGTPVDPAIFAPRGALGS